MLTINIHAAKTQLSRLVDQAARGESFIIAKAGKPKVKVVPLNESDTVAAKRIGFMAGEFVVPDDFDRMGSEGIEGLFAGRTP